MIYDFYTDGAATMKQVNGEYVREAGGWAWVLIDNNKIIDQNKGNFKATTNNYCELYSINKVFEYVIKNQIISSEINIYSDSAYCVNMLNNNGWIYSWIKNQWKRKGGKIIENLPLVQHLYLEMLEIQKSSNIINFIKVKGHSNNIFNNVVDSLAVEAKKDAVMGKIY